MNINETLKIWIEDQKENYDSLDDYEVITMGEDDVLDPPYISIITTGSSERVDSGVVMRGVSDFSVEVQLVNIPVDDADGGESPESDRQAVIDLYNIVADTNAIEILSGAESWRVFDIRTEGFNTEATDGRRVTTYPLTVTACPI